MLRKTTGETYRYVMKRTQAEQAAAAGCRWCSLVLAWAYAPRRLNKLKDGLPIHVEVSVALSDRYVTPAGLQMLHLSVHDGTHDPPPNTSYEKYFIYADNGEQHSGFICITR